MWPFSSSEPSPAVFEPSLKLASSFSTDRVPTDQLPTAYPPTKLTSAGDRLNLIFPVRLPLVSSVAFLGGLMIGGAKGGFTAADRYRAENAHRLPISRSGWYLYHKSKNYHSVLGSLKEGSKQGLIVMAWAALFATTEEIIDRARARLFVGNHYEGDEVDHVAFHKHRDAASTVMAGLTVSGIYSWRQGFDHFGAARMAKVSLKYSLIYGVLQDTLASLKGNHPGYVTWILRKVSGSSTLHDPV